MHHAAGDLVPFEHDCDGFRRVDARIALVAADLDAADDSTRPGTVCPLATSVAGSMRQLDRRR